MSAKTVTKPKTKAKPTKPAEPEAEQSKERFSYEFLEMLTDTAHHALRDHLVKTTADPTILEMTDDLYRLMYAQVDMLRGGQDYSEALWSSVARLSTNISEVGGIFHCPTGSVPLLEDTIEEHLTRRLEEQGLRQKE